MRLSRKCVAGARARRNGQGRNKAGMGVVEPKLAAMEGCNRRCQAQSKTGAGLGSAGLKANKSLHRMLAVGKGNSRAVVGDAEQNLITLSPGLDQNVVVARIGSYGVGRRQHRGSRLAVLDRVLDQIGQCLADQFTVAVKQDRLGLDMQAHAAVFSERLIELVTS